ncbi:hypothetical protein IGI04_023381 [Brassica rapa subsp. trilocularis]|uniref:Uncharacterized protein n=1 Tax=Brassica rapa subsp. trilocularis TaxID=1813537 RepID=A0ABQ7M5V2_BRACM|nr:hypothetical protein IGI04_023381 [Brassica rapa subsp. trilocularis]
MDARGKYKNACRTVRMVRRMRMHNVDLAGEDKLRYGQFGRLVMVPAEAPIEMHAGRIDQSDRYGRMNEPQSNCSERPDLHAGRLQWTDPRTRAHQFRHSTRCVVRVVGPPKHRALLGLYQNNFRTGHKDKPCYATSTGLFRLCDRVDMGGHAATVGFSRLRSKVDVGGTLDYQWQEASLED